MLGNLLINNKKYVQYIWHYNSALSFASHGLDKPEIINEKFSPSLKFQGQFYHLIRPLKPEIGKAPKFAQIFVHDGTMEEQVGIRMKSCQDQKKY